MSDNSTLAGGPHDVTCASCSHVVPFGAYCIRCGWALDLAPRSATRRSVSEGFSAAPDEPVLSVRIVSTLFPQLPKADMSAFRVAFVVGIAFVVGLAMARMFSVALIAAAVVVPLLTLLYLVDVDVYEDEPLHIIALTMIWGAVAGTGVGLALRFADAPVPLGDVNADHLLARGVAVPIADLVLALIGPLVLLRYRRFNDVLDGATFGAMSAVSLVAAQTLVQASSLYNSGLRVPGTVMPWVLRLLEVGFTMPLIVSGVAGYATSTLWLRYRSPIRDRDSLGLLGQPLLAIAIAIAILVSSAIGMLVLERNVAFALLVSLAAIAQLLLRWALHIGLLQEAAEIETAPDIRCANCGRTTPLHSFCAGCGVSLRALPKARGNA
ncbi:MAG: hypothetical protein ABI658_08770 [Acidimicrobiales bacterium]